MRIYLILLVTSLNLFCSNNPEKTDLRSQLKAILAKQKAQAQASPSGGIDESEPSEEACTNALQTLNEPRPSGGERKPRVTANPENLRPLRGNALRESLSLMEPLDPQEMQMRLEVARIAGEAADRRAAGALLSGGELPNCIRAWNDDSDGTDSDSDRK